jgi:amino acid adenylation domain-containing protein
MLALPTDRPREGASTYAYDRVHAPLSHDLRSRLQLLAEQQDASLFELLASAWAIVLGRWSAQEEVIVAVEEGNDYVPVCFDLQSDPVCAQLMARVLAVTRRGDGTESLEGASLPTVAIRGTRSRRARGRFELALSIDRRDGDASLALDYARKLFDRSTATRLLASFEVLLDAVSRKPQTPASRLPVLTERERRRALHVFDPESVSEPSRSLIHELFERQVARDPEMLAVVDGDLQLSYGRLNREANRLARYLRRHGAGRDQLIGLCVERGADMVIGILAILKSGAAYVPMDPAYPVERLAYMIAAAAAPILLTQAKMRAVLPETASIVIEIDGAWRNVDEQHDGNLSRTEADIAPTDLAYVIFTSGSTGVPKGAMNEHCGMVNRIEAASTIEGYDADDICSQKTSLSFVDAVFETLGPLSAGCPLVIVPAAVANDPGALASFVANNRITRLLTVPSLARSLLESDSAMRELSDLRSWTLSGEEVRAELIDTLQSRLPRCRFIVQYGCSEVSSDAAIYVSTGAHRERVPLGKPLPNTFVRILDRHGEPVPLGVVGEIHVCGINVGRGYLGRAELTASRFVRDPYSSQPGARMFKSGDLGRCRADGVLEYFGRADHQVKIRGFRIELGEIEARLLQQPEVREAVVVAREQPSGDKRLVAYVTWRERAGVSGERDTTMTALRRHLKATLPEYMVPAAIVSVPAMPLTPNGKLDRRALPAPTLDAYSLAEYELPLGAVERSIADLWQRLLGVARVGRSDNFFQLGGHSLLIVHLLTELRRLGLFAEARTVYATATLADLAAAITGEHIEETRIPPNAIPAGAIHITPDMLPLVALDDAQLRRVEQLIAGGAGNIQDIYPLAPLQEGLFFHHLLSGASGDAYVRPLLLSLSSRESLGQLTAALETLIARHDVLRTAILWEHLPRPVQVVCRKVALPIEEWVLNPGRDIGEQLEERMRIEHQRLDLTRAPLMKLHVATDPEGERIYALLQTHHLVFDDASLDLMLEELAACIDGDGQELEPAAPYRNHVARALARTSSQQIEHFFRSKLADIDEPTAPFGLVEVHAAGHRVDMAEGELAAQLSRRLRTQARRWGTSAATMFHAAWALVVAGTSGREDVVFGTVLLGRMEQHAETGPAMGMFINTLPLRLRLADTTAASLLERTGRELAELLEHEQASLAVAQRCSGIEGALPLFTALLNYLHGAPDSDERRREIAPGVSVLASSDRTNYPMALSVSDRGDGFSLQVQTDRRVASRRVLEYIRTALESLTEALEHAADTQAMDLRILPEPERRQVVEAFNATAIPRPGPTLMHGLFEAQVKRTPDAMAVCSGEEQLTYDELNRRANRWAHLLIERGVRPDDRIAIFLERSASLAVAVLACQKAGAAYVPVDISYPLARVAYILEDSGASLVLTQHGLLDRLLDTRTEVVALDRGEAIELRSDENPDAAALGLRPTNLAYVIYTSGSTGQPKGVTIEHHAATNHMHWSSSAFGVGVGSRCSCIASFGFDASVWELWPPLCVGATVVLADANATRDPDSTLRWWQTNEIHVGFLATPLAELTFAQRIHKPELQHLLVGGDRLRTRVKRQSYALVNNYGPTETTVVCTSGVIHDDDDSLHIGRPIDNYHIYILDRRLRPVPIGVTGEIYIGGAGVARGYLQRPELTADRFITDSLGPRAGARMFRSGDLGRWRPDGNIEYVGRNDHQVKIRGLRIELGEIEAQLASHPRVKDVVVVIREIAPGEARLLAYVIPADLNDIGSVLMTEALRTHLRERLPQYMVPSAIVTLERFPLTTNGKLDRQALPVAEMDPLGQSGYQDPEGALEQLVASIWQGVLRVERVGRDDDFFELGGHSLLATQMLGRLRSALAWDVSMRNLFDFPTVRQLVEYLRQAGVPEQDATTEDDMDELLAEMAALPPAEREELLRQLNAGDR